MPLFNPTGWTAYTPTISATSGTITTASASGRYRLFGKTCYYAMSVAITTNGTGSGAVDATLPLAAANNGIQFTASGRGSAGVFTQVMGFIVPNTASLRMARYDGTYPGANGNVWHISGFYEIA